MTTNQELRTTMTNGVFDYTLRLFPYGDAWRVQYTKVKCDVGYSALSDHEDESYPTYGTAWQHYWRVFNYMVGFYKIETVAP